MSREWPTTHDRGAERDRPGRWSSPCGPFDAPERHICHQNPQIQGNDPCPAGDCKAICREGDSNHKFNIAPNLLDRDFNADAPILKWAGDISYIWTREGWLYLAVILDLHSRRVIGWAVSNRMKRDLAIRALKPLGTLRGNALPVSGWPSRSVSRQRAASTIPTGAANIVPTIIRRP